MSITTAALVLTAGAGNRTERQQSAG